MSGQTPQCKRVSTFIEQVYRDEDRTEPPCTVQDVNCLDVQINVHEQGSTLQTLTLKFLKDLSDVSPSIEQVIRDFLKNPNTRSYP
jgi:hypothetical protein